MRTFQGMVLFAGFFHRRWHKTSSCPKQPLSPGHVSKR